MRAVLWTCFALTLAATLAARIAGPSDLAEKTQDKTIAYTADMVLHGRWLLPRHVTGEPATKPPLYNWLAAAALAATGQWTEWVFKLPSILAGLALAAVTIAITTWMWKNRDGPHFPSSPRSGAPSPAGVPDPTNAPQHLQENRDGPHFPAQDSRTACPTRPENGVRPYFSIGPTADAGAMGILAGTILLSGYSVFKLIYVARPDMLQGALLCAAWALGTGVLARAAGGERGGPARWRALVMWLCIGMAALAKGPPAVLAVLYLPLAARLIYGRWSLVHATGWWWGLPLAGAMYAGWLAPVALADPDHFRRVLVGEEVVGRVVGGGIGEILAGVWKIPVYFFGRFAPWSAIAALALIRIRPRRWRSHPLAPAILWMLLILLAYSFSAGKLSRYLLPAYPAAAALAAWWLVDVGRKLRRIARHIAVAAVLIALGQGACWWTLARPARTGYGEAIKAFAAEVRPIVGDEPVVFRTGWCDILPPLLARHQVGEPTPEQLAAARWEIVTWRAKSPRGEPVVRSGVAHGEKAGELRLALYRRPPPKTPPARPGAKR